VARHSLTMPPVSGGGLGELGLPREVALWRARSVGIIDGAIGGEFEHGVGLYGRRRRVSGFGLGRLRSVMSRSMAEAADDLPEAALDGGHVTENTLDEPARPCAGGWFQMCHCRSPMIDASRISEKFFLVWDETGDGVGAGCARSCNPYGSRPRDYNLMWMQVECIPDDGRIGGLDDGEY